MIAHEAIGVHLPSRLVTSFSESFEEGPAVGIIQENGFLVIATVHDMVNVAWILRPNLSGHELKSRSGAVERKRNVETWRTDPFMAAFRLLLQPLVSSYLSK